MTDLKFTNEAEFYSAIKAFRLVEVGRQSFGGQSGWTVQYEDEPRSFGRKPEIFGECTSLDDGSEFYGTITVRSCGVHHKGAPERARKFRGAIPGHIPGYFRASEAAKALLQRNGIKLKGIQGRGYDSVKAPELEGLFKMVSGDVSTPSEVYSVWE